MARYFHTDDNDTKFTEVGTYLAFFFFFKQTLFNYISFPDPLVTKHRYPDLPLVLISWNKPINDDD